MPALNLPGGAWVAIAVIVVSAVVLGLRTVASALDCQTRRHKLILEAEALRKAYQQRIKRNAQTSARVKSDHKKTPAQSSATENVQQNAAA